MADKNKMLCKCGQPATINVRHGLEDHPHCADCAEWWNPSRHSTLLSDAQYAEQERAIARQLAETAALLAE